MRLRIAPLPIAAAFAGLALLTVPAIAAMPVGDARMLANDSAVLHVAQKKKMTRRQEVDKSVETGTVPARYRSSIPKRYHQYIPFAKQ